MPSKIKHKNTSPKTRGSSHSRKAGQKRRRKRHGKQKPSAPKIIANSIFALTLKDKPGLEVQDKLGSRNMIHGDYKNENYVQMYQDLRDVYQKATFLATGEKTKYDPYNDGLEIGISLWSIINGFKNNIMPKDFDVRIDRDDHLGYYFTIYKACDFEDYWHAFEVRYIAEWLAANDPRLHDTFIRFISFIKSRLGIAAWYDGALGYAECYIDDELDNWEFEHGADDADDDDVETLWDGSERRRPTFERAWDDYASYHAGLVSVYQDFIENGYTNQEKLLKELSTHNKHDKLVQVMKAFVDFIVEVPGKLWDYVYAEMQEEESFEGLSFDQQVAIVWDWDDHITSIQMDCIDNEANNFGSASPIFHYHITKYTTDLQFDKHVNWLEWPSRLNRLWEQYRDVATIYKQKSKKQNERKDRVAIANI